MRVTYLSLSQGHSCLHYDWSCSLAFYAPQEGKQQKVVRLVSPVNPMPQEVPRPKGVGRKGTAVLPKAAQVCHIMNSPSVPSSPAWRSIADAAPGQQLGHPSLSLWVEKSKSKSRRVISSMPCHEKTLLSNKQAHLAPCMHCHKDLYMT